MKSIKAAMYRAWELNTHKTVEVNSLIAQETLSKAGFAFWDFPQQNCHQGDGYCFNCDYIESQRTIDFVIKPKFYPFEVVDKPPIKKSAIQISLNPRDTEISKMTNPKTLDERIAEKSPAISNELRDAVNNPQTSPSTQRIARKAADYIEIIYADREKLKAALDVALSSVEKCRSYKETTQRINAILNPK